MKSRQSWYQGILACVIGSPFALGAGAQFQTGEGDEYTISPNTIAVQLMPEIAKAPAPAWVKPGLRITVDKIDGTVIAFPINGDHGGGGHGFDQYDILAVQPNAVVISGTGNLICSPAGGAITSTQSGLVTTPGAALDLWIHPDVFHKYMNLNQDGVSSVPVDYPAAGKTFHAMDQTILTRNSVTHYVRDIETGLLLHSSQDINDINGKVISQSTLKQVRQLKIPWHQGRLPQSLSNIHHLTFEGPCRIGGFKVVRVPVTVRSQMKVVGRGTDFLQISRSTVTDINGVKNDLGISSLVTGPSQLTPLAIDPDDLASLKLDQELDRDPISGVTTKITAIGRSKTGKDIVRITASAREIGGQTTEYIYDRHSGMMIAVVFDNPMLNQVTEMILTATD